MKSPNKLHSPSKAFSQKALPASEMLFRGIGGVPQQANFGKWYHFPLLAQDTRPGASHGTLVMPVGVAPIFRARTDPFSRKSHREYDNTLALQLESQGVVVSHSLDLVRALWMQSPMGNTLNRVRAR